MIKSVAIMLSGFTIFSIPLILAMHFRYDEYQNKPIPKYSGIALLIGLLLIQLYHFVFLEHALLWYQHWSYAALLFIIAPCFYFFSLELLRIDVNYRLYDMLHFAPLLLVGFIPNAWVIPIAFTLGSGYVAWLFFSIYKLRGQRQDMQREIMAIGVLFVLAITALLLGFSRPFFEDTLFISLYTITIGCAFLVADLALLQNPAITRIVAEAAEATYATSTLNHIDTTEKLRELKTIVEVEKAYRDDTLSMESLAQKLDLSHHQLSELINTQLKKGFSQYIREQRIAEAKQLLIDEPKSSILAISLEVGFNSQSNFYTAFKQTEGYTPGQYRKQHST